MRRSKADIDKKNKAKMYKIALRLSVKAPQIFEARRGGKYNRAKAKAQERKGEL